MSALTARLIILGFSLLTTAFGFAIVFVPLRKRRKVKSTYDLVSATCIRVEVEECRSYDSEGSSEICFRPVWEYHYAAVTWTSRTKTAASYLNIPVGTVMDIYVCPDDPEKIYVPYGKDIAFTTVFGMVWLIAGVAGCIFAWLADL